VGIALAVYAFFPSKQDSVQKKGDEAIPLHVPRETVEPKPAGHIDSSAELQQLKNEQRNLQAQLESAGVLVKGLREELVKATAATPVNEDIDQLKRENMQLKDELMRKSLELDKLNNQKLDFNKGQEENKAKLESLSKENQQLLEKIKALEEKAGQSGEQVPKKDYDELNNKLSNLTEQANKLEAATKENADLANKIKLLEGQIAEYMKEEASLKAAVEDSKKEGEQAVPKKDFDDLDKKLSEETSKAEGLEKENSDAVNKIKLLEMQIEQYKKESEKAAALNPKGLPVPEPQDSVPRKEYEEIKKKLKEAEDVLKILHGAGE
jgi:chromosome segregation ATPase